MPFSRSSRHPHEAMPHQRAENSRELCVLPPLLGERAGVRASVSSNRIFEAGGSGCTEAMSLLTSAATGFKATSPKWSAQPLHRQDAFSIPLKTATMKLDALDPLDPVQSLDQVVG